MEISNLFLLFILDCRLEQKNPFLCRKMDEDEDETSSFRPQLFDLSIKRSNSTPAIPLLVTTSEYEEKRSIYFSKVH